MKRIYITGAYGLLGQHLVKQFLSKNFCREIIAIIRFEDLMSSKVDAEEARIRYEELLKTESSELKYISYKEFYNPAENVSDSDDSVLIHLAFARSGEVKPMLASIRLMERVAAAAQVRSIPSLINISSQSIYDPYREKPAAETDLPAPESLYGLTKYYSEIYLSKWAEKNDIRLINLRMASLIGPGLEQRISTRLLKRAIEESIIEIRTNKEIFSFLHIRDAARMIAEVAGSQDKSEYDTYNLGTDESYNLLEMAELICAIMQDNGLATPEIRIEQSEGLQYNNSVSLERLKKDFDLSAKIIFKDSLLEEFRKLIQENEN